MWRYVVASQTISAARWESWSIGRRIDELGSALPVFCALALTPSGLANDFEFHFR